MSTSVFTGSRTKAPSSSPAIAMRWPSGDAANAAKARCPSGLAEPAIR
ncbi:hypothetical protein [Amycolatopsis cihanbeyliensis]|nr:hypothetical protein [Amycolatopsis cihanbeyliensis]